MTDGRARRERVTGLAHAAGRALFGDRVGLVLFLGAVLWFGVTWRVGFFIADTYAVANTLVNVASGHLYIDHIEYSLTLGSSQPGLYISNGRVFGRNYGQVYLALPVYVLLRGVAAVVDLRVAIAAGVSLVGLGFAHQVGVLIERRTLGTVFGSVFALGLFVLNLAWASPLASRWAGLVALQVVTAVGGATLAVALYRLSKAMYDQSVGVALGIAVVAATPVAFWATMPKRHVLTAALTMLTVAAFYASRGEVNERKRFARAGAYLAAGATASVHAGEGAVLLGVLLPLDLLTARSRRRDLVLVGSALLVGLLPFLVTNTLISGNPLLAPRWLGSYSGEAIGPGGTIQTALGIVGQQGSAPPAVVTASVGAAFSGVSTTVLVVLATVPEYAQSVVGAIIDQLGESLAVVTDGERLYHVFLRSGNIPGVRYHINDNEVVELTLLESMPLGALVLTGIGVAVGRVRTVSEQPRAAVGRAVEAIRRDPARQTDLFVMGILGGLTVAYLPRLPLFSQITVRYLLPTMPLWLYLAARFWPVRRAVRTHPRWTAGGFVCGLTVGAAVLLAVLAGIDPALGEAMQFHALVHLGVGSVAVLTVAGGAVRDAWRVPASTLGFTAAVTAVFFLFAGVLYFPYGPPMLPVLDPLADALTLW